MRSGRLDRVLDIQRLTVTLSDSGEPVQTWAAIVTRRAASITPIQGSERFVNPQIIATDQVEFRIRYFADVADLSPLDRIIYPASEVSSPEAVPAEHDIFDILSVNEIGRREGLRIIALRHADAVAVQQIIEAAGLAAGAGAQ